MSNLCRGCNYCIVSFGNFLSHFLLLAMRLFWGYSFFQGGLGKLQNIKPVIKFLESLDIPWPEFSAYLIGGVECIGGLMLLVGLASRFVSIPLAVIMIVAIFTAHYEALEGILDNPQRFINQLPFNYLLTCLVVLSFGPGVFSLDYLIGRKCNAE